MLAAVLPSRTTVSNHYSVGNGIRPYVGPAANSGEWFESSGVDAATLKARATERRFGILQQFIPSEKELEQEQDIPSWPGRALPRGRRAAADPPNKFKAESANARKILEMSKGTYERVPPESITNQYLRANNSLQPLFTTVRNGTGGNVGGVAGAPGGKTVGKWLKVKREKKKEECRARNAQLHAAVSVAGVAASVAAIATAAASASSAGKDEMTAQTDMAVASAAMLVAAQCVEAAEAMGAERDHLTAAITSAVNVRSHGDISTLTAAAATALRGAATLKARALKEGLDVEENFLGACNQELLARGRELLKRTRDGELHWKIVSVYIHRSGEVVLKMKSKYMANTVTKKKKNVVIEVCKDIPAWPGRHLLEDGEQRRYFGLRTEVRGLVEFECKNQKEYDMWTQGVSRLLSIVAERKRKSHS
nr:VAN3-binding protein-like [Ipomoea batatas]